MYKIYNKGPDTEPHIVKVISDTVGLFCIVYIWSCRYDEKHLFTTPQMNQSDEAIENNGTEKGVSRSWDMSISIKLFTDSFPTIPCVC